MSRQSDVRECTLLACHRVGLYAHISDLDSDPFLDRPCVELVEASADSCPISPPYNDTLMTFRARYRRRAQGEGIRDRPGVPAAAVHRGLDVAALVPASRRPHIRAAPGRGAGGGRSPAGQRTGRLLLRTCARSRSQDGARRRRRFPGGPHRRPLLLRTRTGGLRSRGRRDSP